MAPPTPSPQTRFILDAMEADAEKRDSRWERIEGSMDLLLSQVSSISSHQKQMLAQLEINTKAISLLVQDQQRFSRQVAETGEAVARSALDEEETPGSGTDPSPRFRIRGEDGGSPRRQDVHTNRSTEGLNGHGAEGEPCWLPEISFPKFAGEDPRIWLDKCVDCFRFYNVHETMWVTMASLHMEGKAALWWHVFKQRHHRPCSWQQFSTAVEEKFGADDYRRALTGLLNLRQTGSVQDYAKEFQDLRYLVSMHNAGYDEVFFVSQFVRGLNMELQGAVQAQAPESVDRAALLAKIQESSCFAMPGSKGSVNGSPLWRERLLRDYRKASGLCIVDRSLTPLILRSAPEELSPQGP